MFLKEQATLWSALALILMLRMLQIVHLRGLKDISFHLLLAFILLAESLYILTIEFLNLILHAYWHLLVHHRHCCFLVQYVFKLSNLLDIHIIALFFRFFS